MAILKRMDQTNFRRLGRSRTAVAQYTTNHYNKRPYRMAITMRRIPETERMDHPVAADAYARADFTAVNTRFVEDVAESFEGLRPKRLLDLGSGPGDIPIALGRARVASTIIAVDASAVMLDWAFRRIAASPPDGRITLVRADAKMLPFGNGVFDAIVSNSILHHVADPHPFWCEVFRVLLPRGRIFMRDLMRPASIADAHALVNEYARDESEELQGEFFRSLCAAYTVDEVREQLRASGLAMLDVRVASDRHLDVVGDVG